MEVLPCNALEKIKNLNFNVFPISPPLHSIMLCACRTSNGRLHLLPDVGKIPLVDATLIEDPSEQANEDEESLCSASSAHSNTLSTADPVNANNRDFKIFIDGKSGQRLTIHLVAPTAQDKEAWISDISQCLDNIHTHSLLSPGLGGTSGGLFDVQF